MVDKIEDSEILTLKDIEYIASIFDIHNLNTYEKLAIFNFIKILEWKWNLFHAIKNKNLQVIENYIKINIK